MTGITMGWYTSGSYDSRFTHAYYVETSGYLAAKTKVCGTSGVCVAETITRMGEVFLVSRLGDARDREL